MAEADRSEFALRGAPAGLLATERVAAGRSVVASPLLNLAPARPSGATMKHSRPILPLTNSGIGGSAMFSLSPDRRTVDLEVRLDRPRPIDIHLRRLDDDLLIVEIVLSKWSSETSRAVRRFSLDDRNAYGRLAGARDLGDTGIRLADLHAESIAGLQVAPARSRNEGATAYSTERMLAEIAAAECSVTAIAASLHVQLAILHARSLGGAAAAL